jgi:hypothetical protein
MLRVQASDRIRYLETLDGLAKTEAHLKIAVDQQLWVDKKQTYGGEKQGTRLIPRIGRSPAQIRTTGDFECVFMEGLPLTVGPHSILLEFSNSADMKEDKAEKVKQRFLLDVKEGQTINIVLKTRYKSRTEKRWEFVMED